MKGKVIPSVKVILKREATRGGALKDLLFFLWGIIVLFFFLKDFVFPRFFVKFNLWNM